MLRIDPMKLYDGIPSHNHFMELYYGVILRNDIMECYYRMILIKSIPGIPGESPEPPGASGMPPGTPLGPPGGAPGTPRESRAGALTDHKNVISQHISSARSSCLLHPNPFVATHHPEDSSGLSFHLFYNNRGPFGRPQGRPGGPPLLGHGSWVPSGAPRPRTLLHLYIYMYIHLY